MRSAGCARRVSSSKTSTGSGAVATFVTLAGAANPAVEVLCVALTLYWVALLIRVIQSWFPVSSSSPAAGFFSFIHSITEPVLAPVRRLLPDFGGFDLSPMVVFLALIVVQRLLGCGGGLF